MRKSPSKTAINMTKKKERCKNVLLMLSSIVLISPSLSLALPSPLMSSIALAPSSPAIGNKVAFSKLTKSSNHFGRGGAVSASASVSDEDDKQSLPAAVFNLVKACVGSGVLALSSGVAALGDTKSALLPSSLLVGFLGLLSAYTFFNIGRICRLEGEASTLSEAWENEVGKSTAWLVGLCCVLTPFGAALSYSIILGDTFSSLAQCIGLKGVLASRTASILAVHLPILYPLCCLQSLAALSPVSILGVIGIIITCIFMAIRATSGAYSPGGAFFSTIAPALQPSFDAIGMKPLLSPASLVLGSMTATAYLVHFNAPDFYKSLKNNTIPRYAAFTGLGFFFTAAISIAMMALGFLTFGGNSSGMILNNYSIKDTGATFCRLLMAFSLIGSYPFVFKAVKSSLTPFIVKGGEVTEKFNKQLTRALLGLLMGISLLIKDAGFVVGFNGAVMGSAIIYIFPPIIFLKNTKKRVLNGQKNPASKRLFLERTINKLLIALGVVFIIMGGYVSVLNSFYPHLLA